MADDSTLDEEDGEEPPDRHDQEEPDRGKTWNEWAQLIFDGIVALAALWGIIHGNGG
ncbi:hypothetical protein AB0I49_23665 [Streptomyces sp. NPDC050617]|uniref:hypothetical protein n=1 Tax=Streptomyces sp. NPDC050617 TaxID=3154628 RepID=UPI003413D5CC